MSRLLIHGAVLRLHGDGESWHGGVVSGPSSSTASGGPMRHRPVPGEFGDYTDVTLAASIRPMAPVPWFFMQSSNAGRSSPGRLAAS